MDREKHGYLSIVPVGRLNLASVFLLIRVNSGVGKQCKSHKEE